MPKLVDIGGREKVSCSSDSVVGKRGTLKGHRMAGVTSHRLLAAAVVISSLVAFSAFGYPGYSGGAGTSTNPYRIATATDLLLLGLDNTNFDKHFIMVADVNLAGRQFTRAVIPINPGSTFVGVFNGGGHSVMNLIVNYGGAAGGFPSLWGYVRHTRVAIEKF